MLLSTSHTENDHMNDRKFVMHISFFLIENWKIKFTIDKIKKDDFPRC